MKRYLCAMGALVFLGLSARASAQTYYEQTFAPVQPVHWHFDVGYSPTIGTTSQYFQGGWTFGGGLTWQPRPTLPIALRADLDFTQFNATRNLIAINEAADQTQIDGGYGDVIGLNVDAEYRVPVTRSITGFTLVGIGVAHMHVGLTQTLAFGSYLCDPWFGYCAYGLVPGQVEVASGSSTRFSWNAGAGLDFALSDGETLFVEARYERIQTSQPTEFVPITVGLRF
jgi:opacity protein-like surface antigen